MKTLNTLIGLLSLPTAVLAFLFAVGALLETEVNWYKAAFFFVVMIANMNAFLQYWANRD